MAKNDRIGKSGDKIGVSWADAGLVGRAGEESDVPADEPLATSDELREAAEKHLGDRGDLGDSGPGED